MNRFFVELIPSELAHESGKVFYSGRVAFSGKAPLYILGINPGGDPDNYTTETVKNHTRQVLTQFPDNWSAYRDEFWGNAKPGTYGMAPRILHLLQQLGFDPGLVPASNLIFVRSRRENHIKKRQAALANLCWPFHDRVLTELRLKVILCLGRKAGKYVRNKIGANQLMAQFEEQEIIAQHLDSKTAEIDQQKDKIKQAIALLKEYRTALITNAVTGKIDVRDIKLPESEQHN